ncbi:ComF family protein [Oceanobacillus massiliensis]|uniref:ComF family protein n=1 Tax=Oceanobacillus massiliensis TaxID=1465765 RepID=UPI003017522E
MTSEKLCADCRSWGNGTTDLLEFNHSIFTYNKMMQDIITKWKYRGDYILGNIFKSYVIEAFKIRFAFLEKDFVAIPIPLSEERMKERGFNQAQVLAEFLPVQHADILTRKHGIKQSKRTRMERISAENPFFIGQHINNPVILVDDIYTTGTTLRHAARLLKEHGCPEIYAFTLIRG